MQNRYNYIGDEDFIGNNMYAHRKFMQEYNLSCAAMREFAFGIKMGDLNALKKEFTLLSRLQKQGLLESYIDFENLWGIPDMSAPSGLPLEIAKQFNHQHIIEFLNKEKEKLFSHTMVPITTNEKGQYVFPKSPCGILPFFIKDNKIVWGCIETNRVRIVANSPPAGTQNIDVAKDAEYFSIEVSKPLKIKELNGYNLLLMSGNYFDDAVKKLGKPILLQMEDGSFKLWGDTSGKGDWKETVLVGFHLPEEWKKQKEVFLSHDNNILKEGHTQLNKDFLQPFIEKCDLLLKNAPLTEVDIQEAKLNKRPILINHDKQLSIFGYDGQWKETILTDLTVEEFEYLQALFLSIKDNHVIIKNKDINEPLLKIVERGHILGKSVSEENFQDIVNCFIKNGYKVYVEDMLKTAAHETKEEHGVDISIDGSHRHLLVCLCEFAEQKILAKRGTTTQKVYTAYIDLAPIL